MQENKSDLLLWNLQIPLEIIIDKKENKLEKNPPSFFVDIFL